MWYNTHMKIERDILKALQEWKNSPCRKPLLLKGVRQCGKSWVLSEFGRRNFTNVVKLNFDRDSRLSSFFEGSYDPKRILNDLSIYTHEEIRPEETLLIFDEIQTCSRALNSLKYFCEDAPEYAIAAAGSLLGITLARSEGFPVGKVDIMELFPCSFKEYLRAVDEPLANYIETIPLEPLPDAFAEKLSYYFRTYLALGGMPEVLSTYLDTNNLAAADHVTDSILQSYEADFAKHIPTRDISKLFLIWKSIPVQFAKENRKFLYGEVKSGARARDLEDALEWLMNAALVKKVMMAEVPEMPLLASADRKTFKLYPCDVGILRKLAELPPNVIVQSQDIFSTFKGKLAENYVLEQLSALGITPICYWYNSSGLSEVDFLIQAEGQVIPIEVKSGLSLSAKSLRVFREKYHPNILVRTSMQNLRKDDNLLNIPLYLLSELPRLLHD